MKTHKLDLLVEIAKIVVVWNSVKDNEWWTVGTKNWDIRDARVVCKKKGLRVGKENASYYMQ